MRKAKNVLLISLAAVLIGLCGCKRSEEDFDNRTLEKRPVTDTVKPVDRSDAFRP